MKKIDSAIDGLIHIRAPMLEAKINRSNDMQAQMGKGEWIAEHYEGFADRQFIRRVRFQTLSAASDFVRSCGYRPRVYTRHIGQQPDYSDALVIG